jgi:hypothetical protein
LKLRAISWPTPAATATSVNPHEVLGGGRDADMLVVARQAVREAVLDRIGTLGCCGKG